MLNQFRSHLIVPLQRLTVSFCFFFLSVTCYVTPGDLLFSNGPIRFCVILRRPTRWVDAAARTGFCRTRRNWRRDFPFNDHWSSTVRFLYQRRLIWIKLSLSPFFTFDHYKVTCCSSPPFTCITLTGKLMFRAASKMDHELWTALQKLSNWQDCRLLTAITICDRSTWRWLLTTVQIPAQSHTRTLKVFTFFEAVTSIA